MTSIPKDWGVLCDCHLIARTIIATTNKGFRKTAKTESAHIFTCRSAHSIQAAFFDIFDIIVAEYQRRNGG